MPCNHIRLLFVLPALFLALLITGCASNQAKARAEADAAPAETADADSLADAEDAEGDDQLDLVRPGPPVSPPAPAIAATRSQDAASPSRPRSRTPRQQGPAPAAAAEQPDDTAILVQASRSDGRPEWWIDAPDRSEGRLRVAAEALGHDVLEARRAAVSAGRRALERLAGAELDDERVLYATVRPLPRGAAPTGPRFVGYVLMSALGPDSE